jgi:peptidoglycan/xylan/chitin deacetylase (PgdA/CDA1 family)
MYDIAILMLHSINNSPKKNPMGVLSVSTQGLESYLKVFKSWNYQMISMDDFVNRCFDQNKDYVVLTFDDGYKDNLTAALPIMKKYNARATIFVNPAYVSYNTDVDSDWGFMTWDEILKAEESGVFDIQAHTMTHEFIFTSDKIVDYYTPDKFNQYYWLAWMLYPESPRQWDSTAYKYRDMIPVGYPIFEYNRRISARKFTPDSVYVDYIIKNYGNTDKINEYVGLHGKLESQEEYENYITWEIVECKKILEDRLNKRIHTLCFPGGGYTEFALRCAEKTGYLCYMTASRMRIGKNTDHVEKLFQGKFCGLNRTSFSRIHPGVLPDSFWDYWTAKLSFGTYQNIKGYSILKKLLSKILHS